MDTCIIGEWKEENYNKKANATIYQKQSQVNYRSIRLCVCVRYDRKELVVVACENLSSLSDAIGSRNSNVP